MASKIYLMVLALAAASFAQQCPIQFDGRVDSLSTPASFDTLDSPFNPSYVFGQNLSWGQVILLPIVLTSLFDFYLDTLSLEVTLTDESIFVPGGNPQTGFRRAELLPASNNGSDPSTIGVKTLHFSIRLDNARPLNFSHEYQLVFLETADYSTNQFALKTGTIIGQPATANPNLLVLESNVEAPTTLFSVEFAPDVWHNFGLVLDFNANTTEVLYSTDNSPLAAVTTRLPNNLSGRGQFHFGALKKPTGDGLTDITTQGYQESGINEGVIFGGIFEEDSSDGCISLEPSDSG